MALHRDTITLKIDAPEISTQSFLKGAKAFFGLIKELTREICAQGPVRWLVSIEQGSQVLKARPESANVPSAELGMVSRAFRVGMKQIERRRTRPMYYNDRALEHARNLAAVAQENGAPFQVRAGNDWFKLTGRVSRNITDLLGTFEGIGTIEGKLQAIYGRTGFTIHVYHDISDKPVACHLKDEQLTAPAIAAFGRRVAVTGDIVYRQDGTPISIVVEKLMVFQEDDDLPTVDDIRRP